MQFFSPFLQILNVLCGLRNHNQNHNRVINRNNNLQIKLLKRNRIHLFQVKVIAGRVFYLFGVHIIYVLLMKLNFLCFEVWVKSQHKNHTKRISCIKIKTLLLKIFFLFLILHHVWHMLHAYIVIKYQNCNVNSTCNPNERIL